MSQGSLVHASAKKRVKGLGKMLVDLSDSIYSCIYDHIDTGIDALRYIKTPGVWSLQTLQHRNECWFLTGKNDGKRINVEFCAAMCH